MNELLNIRRSALTAAISLAIMTLAAIFSYGFVLGRLVVDGDPSTTFLNIKTNKLLFETGIAGWLIIIICDIIVAWSFYLFLKPINRYLSLLAAWLRTIYAIILTSAVLNLVFIAELVRMEQYYSSTLHQLQNCILTELNTFHFMWSVGLMFFGLHLMIVGYLTFKSKTIPKLISILLWITAISYLLIHYCYVFLPQINEETKLIELILSVPMALGEISFGVWLLIRGRKASKAQ